MQPISRRAFIKSGLVSGAAAMSGVAPAIHADKNITDYDVVVIGAG